MPDIDRSLPVVFIHGIGGGARLWTPQITSFLAAGYRPVALDLPGYGERPAVDRMDFEGLAADIEAEIARLGLARPALVGHSMGGMVAQTALRRRPHAYRAAVLACTSPAFGSGTGAFQKKFVADRLAPLEAGKTMADISRTVVAAMGPNPDRAGRALASAAIAATPERTYRAAVHCLVGFDERANLAAIGIPVLCLAGELDPLAPPRPGSSGWREKFPMPATSAYPGSATLPILRRRRRSTLSCSRSLRRCLSCGRVIDSMRLMATQPMDNAPPRDAPDVLAR